MQQQAAKQLTQQRWIGLTLAGWVIGILFVVGFSLLGEVLFNTKEESGGQAAVGLGMGTGVGLMQWVVLRKYLGSVLKWLWFSIIGFTLSYVSFDLLAAHTDMNIQPEIALPAATTLGALICSWLQYKYVLRKITFKASRWIACNTIAWLLAHLACSGMVLINMKTSFEIPRLVIALCAFLFLGAGGLVLGFITGRFMVPLVNKHRPAAN